MTQVVESQSFLPAAFHERVGRACGEADVPVRMTKLWRKDASLWSDDATIQGMIRERLGWLSIASVMDKQVASIQETADALRREGFTHALLLGMGGSCLFAEVCRGLFGVTPGWLDLAVLDSTDPHAILAAERRAPLERTVVIVSSKSGTTTEARALGDYFYKQLRKRVGDRAGKQCLAITDEGTPLQALAASREFRRVFAHGRATGQDVGGRFSALTYFGLLPAALMGVKIRELLARAKAMAARCGPKVPAADNPAAQLGVALQDALASGRDKVTILPSPALAEMGTWIEQLIAESTGKSGKGLIPILGERLQDGSGKTCSDRLFVELQVADGADAQLEETVLGLAEAGHPVIRLRWQDRYDVGGDVMRWSLATALVSSFMGINPFDEPNVKESKDRTNAFLDQYASEGHLPDEAAPVREGNISVYSRGSGDTAGSVADVLRTFLASVRANEYVAVLSFLPRSAVLDAAVESWRQQLAKRLGVATMVGFGPRYLHSTGQLHKGGPDRLSLLMLTADDPEDLDVPGQDYSFGILKHAQALGDYQALTERNRRIVRLHLREPLEAAIGRLAELTAS